MLEKLKKCDIINTQHNKYTIFKNGRKEVKMNIVCITACPTGIAHTYITKEKLEAAARARGHGCRIETQGSIGAENELTPEEIKAADVVILAVDVKISGEDRFKGKPTVKVPTETVMQNAGGLIEAVEKKLKAAGRS